MHECVAYNSCRNRHCPKCQGAAARQWLAEREAELLPVPYYHVVFTLPAAIGAIALQPRVRSVRDLQIPIGRAQPNRASSSPRFPPYEAFERRPRVKPRTPAKGRRPKPFSIAAIQVIVLASHKSPKWTHASQGSALLGIASPDENEWIGDELSPTIRTCEG